MILTSNCFHYFAFGRPPGLVYSSIPPGGETPVAAPQPVPQPRSGRETLCGVTLGFVVIHCVICAMLHKSILISCILVLWDWHSHLSHLWVPTIYNGMDDFNPPCFDHEPYGFGDTGYPIDETDKMWIILAVSVRSMDGLYWSEHFKSRPLP